MCRVLSPCMGLIKQSSFDVKYMAPGFDIFQKPNENVLLTLFFMIFFACVLLKVISLKILGFLRRLSFVEL